MAASSYRWIEMVSGAWILHLDPPSGKAVAWIRLTLVAQRERTVEVWRSTADSADRQGVIICESDTLADAKLRTQAHFMPLGL